MNADVYYTCEYDDTPPLSADIVRTILIGIGEDIGWMEATLPDGFTRFLANVPLPRSAGQRCPILMAEGAAAERVEMEQLGNTKLYGSWAA